MLIEESLASFNIISVLIDFIVKINRRKFPEKQAKDGDSKWSFFIIHWKTIVFNCVIIIGIALTCFAYKYDWFARENVINQQVQVEQQAVQESTNQDESVNDSEQESVPEESSTQNSEKSVL